VAFSPAFQRKKRPYGTGREGKRKVASHERKKKDRVSYLRWRTKGFRPLCRHNDKYWGGGKGPPGKKGGKRLFFSTKAALKEKKGEEKKKNGGLLTYQAFRVKEVEGGKKKKERKRGESFVVLATANVWPSAPRRKGVGRKKRRRPILSSIPGKGRKKETPNRWGGEKERGVFVSLGQIWEEREQKKKGGKGGNGQIGRVFGHSRGGGRKVPELEPAPSS